MIVGNFRGGGGGGGSQSEGYPLVLPPPKYMQITALRIFLITLITILCVCVTLAAFQCLGMRLSACIQNTVWRVIFVISQK